MRLSTKLGTYHIVQVTPPDDGDGAVFRVSSRERAELERLVGSAGLRVDVEQAGDEVGGWQFTASQRDLLDLMVSLAETVDYERF